MDEERPPIIDAEFTVVREADPPRKWWEGWQFNYDWTWFFIGLAGLIGSLLRLSHHR